MGAAHPSPARLGGALALAALLAGCVRLPPMLARSDALSAREHFRLGAAYEAQGQRADAALQYQTAVRRDSSLADAWVALGNLAFMDGRLKEAESAFRKALKASPRHQAANNNLAMALLARGGSMSQAEARALEALAQPGPLRPYVLDTLARIYVRQGRRADAEAAIEQAEAAAPQGEPLVRVQLSATRELIRETTWAR